MKIIICGAEEVGFSLAKYLSSENMQVTVIDEDIEKLQIEVAKKLGYKLVDHKLELYGSKIKK